MGEMRIWGNRVFLEMGFFIFLKGKNMVRPVKHDFPFHILTFRIVFRVFIFLN